jgi:hypothetical protein
MEYLKRYFFAVKRYSAEVKNLSREGKYLFASEIITSFAAF